MPSLRTLMRCADDERKELLGIVALPAIGFCAQYEPGPGVSSPIISSFISRADEPPNAPQPALFERPNELRARDASSPLLSGWYAPGSPTPKSSTRSRAEPDLNAELAPDDELRLVGFLDSYIPGPGIASPSFVYGSSRAGCREPKPGLARLLRSTDLATVAATDPSICASYAPGPTDGSVVVRSDAKREPWPRIVAPELFNAGSTADIFGR